MFWLTWRQFRAQAVVTTAALLVFAIVFAVTGMHVAHLYNATGAAACPVQGNCATLASRFLSQLTADATYHVLYGAGLVLVYVAPALIGVFWGAPLVTREIEAGTFRLAWNQGVTRTRWLAAKLGLIGLAAMTAAGLISLMVTWWAGPVDRAIQTARSNSALGLTRMDPAVFGARGIAPVGYAAFGFVLGVTAGVLIRRTVPAMAATLAAFAGIQLARPIWVRPHLFSPVHVIAPLTSFNQLQVQDNTHMTVIGSWNQPGAWVISNQSITPAGHLFTGPATQPCLTGSSQACSTWLASKHLRQLVTYQPASRFWELQWYETGIFLGLALLLAGFCAWWISRRRLA
jgi:hypothetical protein